MWFTPPQLLDSRWPFKCISLLRTPDINENTEHTLKAISILHSNESLAHFDISTISASQLSWQYKPRAKMISFLPIRTNLEQYFMDRDGAQVENFSLKETFDKDWLYGPVVIDDEKAGTENYWRRLKRNVVDFPEIKIADGFMKYYAVVLIAFEDIPSFVIHLYSPYRDPIDSSVTGNTMVTTAFHKIRQQLKVIGQFLRDYYSLQQRIAESKRVEDWIKLMGGLRHAIGNKMDLIDLRTKRLREHVLNSYSGDQILQDHLRDIHASNSFSSNFLNFWEDLVAISISGDIDRRKIKEPFSLVQTLLRARWDLTLETPIASQSFRHKYEEFHDTVIYVDDVIVKNIKSKDGSDTHQRKVFSYEIGDGTIIDPQIYGRETAVAFFFYELLKNAVKYRSDNSSIVVKLQNNLQDIIRIRFINDLRFFVFRCLGRKVILGPVSFDFMQNPSCSINGCLRGDELFTTITDKFEPLNPQQVQKIFKLYHDDYKKIYCFEHFQQIQTRKIDSSWEAGTSEIDQTGLGLFVLQFVLRNYYSGVNSFRSGIEEFSPDSVRVFYEIDLPKDLRKNLKKTTLSAL